MMGGVAGVTPVAGNDIVGGGDRGGDMLAADGRGGGTAVLTEGGTLTAAGCGNVCTALGLGSSSNWVLSGAGLACVAGVTGAF